jgi:transposase
MGARQAWCSLETADVRRGKKAVRADDEVVAASELRRLEERVRELERLLGRKTMEVEILNEALELARAKKPTLLSLSPPAGDTR